MRALWLFPALLCVATPAFALGDSIIDYCLTTKDPKGCIQSFLAEKEQYLREIQRENIAAQLEQARIQANGMALFGAGAAMQNGVNQGFQNMQLPPVRTPAPYYVPTQR